MQTECSTDRFDFQPLKKREIREMFDGGVISSKRCGILPVIAEELSNPPLVTRDMKCKTRPVGAEQQHADMGRFQSQYVRTALDDAVVCRERLRPCTSGTPCKTGACGAAFRSTAWGPKTSRQRGLTCGRDSRHRVPRVVFLWLSRAS